MSRKLNKFLAGACLSLFGLSAQAGFLPFGVQTNVDINTVTNTWGWTQCYQSAYADIFGTSASTTLANCTGSYLMLAGREVNSDNLIALAAALKSDVLLDVGNGADAHHLANGSEWYNSDNFSIGFAMGGDSTFRNVCDTSAVNGDQRLCWHTVDSTGGWRVGTNTGLNDSEVFERLAFMLDDVSVPEPATVALLALGLVGAGLGARRRAS
jgi:hypothetical protein